MLQSLVNDQQLEELRNIAEATAQALQEKEFTKATQLWGEAEDFVTMVNTSTFCEDNMKNPTWP